MNIMVYVNLLLLMLILNKSYCYPTIQPIVRLRPSLRPSFTVSLRSTTKTEVNDGKKQKQSIVIIGGGIAGLSCASLLSKSDNYDQVTLFDTGRLRPGGRCSSRFPNDTTGKHNTKKKNSSILSNYIIDHAAQLIAVSEKLNENTEFITQLHQWVEQGIIQKFPDGSVCEILNSTAGAIEVRPVNQAASSTKYYHGIKGMGSIPLAMLEECRKNSKNFVVSQNLWVPPDAGVEFVSDFSDQGSNTKKNHWKIQIRTKQKVLGTFDKLVIAHNGKCADRLMSNSPAKDIHSLLKVSFSDKPTPQKMTLSSIYSLTFCLRTETSPFSSITGTNFICGYIRNEPNLSFLSCQSRKYPRKTETAYEVWTVFSSATFGKKYKSSQENLPPAVVEEVTRSLLSSLETSLNLMPGCLMSPSSESTTNSDPVVLESRLQLWGAAVPLNNWKQTKVRKDHSNDNSFDGFLYDGVHGVGVCGDWLLESSIAGAWESGRRLAEYMIKQDLFNVNDGNMIGFSGKFQPSIEVGKTGIGSI